ncbi:Uncharacterized membrane protein YcaP, DUF421 family [Amphibacillus marinus]|uniref:Uncharacterized membrane protein YcaP, DUF421 family n=1 Tax=Amphibacillus marinus TaxID=872970 RepID=A0A1H8M8I9_9BACI|nr:DUF421 domain-containing protein [Amphibacillus marinus]SEO13643.1 Uncharacterized membrane protein YcaP, DUF421 family [Amphibacillus marinus]
MDYLSNSALIIGRIITIIPLLLFIVLYMGKRAIGQLPVFDFLIIIVLGSVVGADIADPDIEHFPTIVAIISIALLQRTIANWKRASQRLNRLLTFEPTVVITNGQLLYKNLRTIRYTTDIIFQMLREKDVFDINDVETGIIEPNGVLTVLKKSDKRNVTKADIGSLEAQPAITFPVIIEGVIDRDILKHVKTDEQWLFRQLDQRNIGDLNEVFLATINSKLELHVTLKNLTNIEIPLIKL